MDFGSGPSWTVCLFALVTWGKNREPTLWYDRELVCQRLAAHEIAVEIITAVRSEYGHNHCFVGDPSGRNKESDQESWESNLRRAGVPIDCLPADYNTPLSVCKTPPCAVTAPLCPGTVVVRTSDRHPAVPAGENPPVAGLSGQNGRRDGHARPLPSSNYVRRIRRPAA
jgi:hypothetical protein